MKKIPIVVVTASTVCFIFLFSCSMYLFSLVLSNQTPKPEFFFPYETPVSAPASNYEDITIVKDDATLHGYIYNGSKEEWVIVVHGYNSKASDVDFASKKFHEMGYHVLAVDLRSHGQSDGTYIGLGWLDQYDVQAWIEYISENYDCPDMILYGVSMGATTVLNTAANYKNEQIIGVIEDSAFTTPQALFDYHLQNTLSLPSFPVLPFTDLLVKVKLGFSLKEGPGNDVDEITCPVLFIHGTSDPFVPVSMAKELYKEATCPKELLLVEGAGHLEANEKEPKVYWNTIKNFIQEKCK